MPSFWEFLCGRCPRVIMRVHQVAIPPEFAQGDYDKDSEFRGTFHRWLGDLWERKDAEIDTLLQAKPTQGKRR